MTDTLITTHELSGTRVVGGKSGDKRIGKVRSFVFHPKAKRCIGFIVKRPDVALMFHRKDLFVAVGGFDFVDGRVVVRTGDDATGKAACKRLGVDWDECVLWVGLPVMCEDGTKFGTVGSVTFDLETGKVRSVNVDAGATANALLGRRVVPASHIKGFKRGLGAKLVETGREAYSDDSEELLDENQFGALVVSDEVKSAEVEGGLADKAGRATAVAGAKAKEAGAKAKAAMDKARPSVDDAAKSAEKAVNKGAYVVGRQIERSKGMFAAFKEEYDKARNDEGTAK